MNLRAQGTNAREMSNAIKVGIQNITITLPNGIKLTIHINKGNVFISPYIYGVLEKSGYQLVFGTVNNEMVFEIVSYDKGSTMSMKGTYKPETIVDSQDYSNIPSENTEDDSIYIYTNMGGGENPGRVTPSIVDFECSRGGGGGFNKDLFPLSYVTKR